MCPVRRPFILGASFSNTFSTFSIFFFFNKLPRSAPGRKSPRTRTWLDPRARGPPVYCAHDNWALPSRFHPYTPPPVHDRLSVNFLPPRTGLSVYVSIPLSLHARLSPFYYSGRPIVFRANPPYTFVVARHAPEVILQSVFVDGGGGVTTTPSGRIGRLTLLDGRRSFREGRKNRRVQPLRGRRTINLGLHGRTISNALEFGNNIM